MPSQSSAIFWAGAISEMLKRRGHRGNANPQSADKPGDDERINIRGEAGPDGRYQVKHADPKQRGPASPAVSGPAAEQRSKHRAVKRRRHRHPVQAGTQSPERLDGFIGAGDDDRGRNRTKIRRGRT